MLQEALIICFSPGGKYSILLYISIHKYPGNFPSQLKKTKGYDCESISKINLVLLDCWPFAADSLQNPY
jgi:hypothetical protein